ncbi:hypothetical protein Plhal304r1_c019g0068811 [Plasmopara halstedii]
MLVSAKFHSVITTSLLNIRCAASYQVAINAFRLNSFRPCDILASSWPTNNVCGFAISHH